MKTINVKIRKRDYLLEHPLESAIRRRMSACSKLYGYILEIEGPFQLRGKVITGFNRGYFLGPHILDCIDQHIPIWLTLDREGQYLVPVI